MARDPVKRSLVARAALVVREGIEAARGGGLDVVQLRLTVDEARAIRRALADQLRHEARDAIHQRRAGRAQ